MSSPMEQTIDGGNVQALNNRYALGTAALQDGTVKLREHVDMNISLSYLGNRVRDSLFLREVSGGRDGPPLSPGDGNNLTTEWRPCQWRLLKNGSPCTARQCRCFIEPVLSALRGRGSISDVQARARTHRSCLMLLQSTHMVGTLVLQCSWNL